MTWHAQAGKLVLSGDERKLFREAVLRMSDYIVTVGDDEDSFFDGASVFDRMTRAQQLASLEVVSRYLFHETPESLPLTAWSEATLASVLHEIRSLVHVEVDEGEKSEWRRVIADLLDFRDEIENFEDAQEWSSVLDAYEERFLWDSDFEDDGVIDLPPEHAQHVLDAMRIPNEYYSAIPPDLATSDNLDRAAKRLWMTVDGKKTFRLTATLTCELPASLEVTSVDDDLVALHGVVPQLELMRVDGQGNLIEATQELFEFFFDEGVVEYSIEEQQGPQPG